MKHESRHNEEDNIEFLKKIPNVLQKNILGASYIDYGTSSLMFLFVVLIMCDGRK